MKRLSILMVFGLIAAVAGGGYWYWQKSTTGGSDKAKSEGKVDGKKGKGKGKGGPVAVRTIPVKRQAMPVVIDAVGSVESEHSVAVRPQVNGTLTAVNFKEGDYVKQGQVLFSIDSRAMQASVAQTQAAMMRDEAQLAQARAQEARLRPLAEKEYITRQEYDVAATQMKSLEATVAANKAVVQAAQLQLSYGQIISPIAGRTGGLSVKVGNLVTGGTGGSPLVVVNSTKPILVALSVPQRSLNDIRELWGKKELKVEIAASGGGAAIATGALVFIDNAVNPTTGTILVKARVKNDREELWPGQFVSARIVLRVEEDAMTLPEGAIQPGQDGPFVFVVKDGRAQIQLVTVDRQLGEQVVVSKGLKGDEQIVIEVPPTLTAGSQVTLRGEGDGKGGKGAKGGKGGKGGKGSKEAAAAEGDDAPKGNKEGAEGRSGKSKE
ncbi:MAG: efflux RND transporter periplasmic adaptor subunit [Burkholderiales bacterium]